MSGNLVPKQGVDVNGHPYTRQVSAGDGGESSSHNLPTAPTATVSSTASPFDGGVVSYEGSHIRLVLGYEGEGDDGDYYPDDENDTPLARFDVYVATEKFAAEDLEWTSEDGWATLKNVENSLCTLIDARTAPESLQHGLARIGEQFNTEIAASGMDTVGSKISQLVEEISHSSDML